MSDDDEESTHGDDAEKPTTNESATAAADDDKKRRKRKRKRKPAAATDDNSEEAAEQDAEAAKEREVDRTVFVEGIPYDCTRDDVSQFFLQHLETSADSLTDIRLPTWPDTGRLKGYGHVVLATCELAQAACALGSKRLYLKKRYLSIAPAKAPSSGAASNNPQAAAAIQGEPSNIIVVHNLSYDATEDDISDVLNSSHIVTGGIRVVRHNATKRSRGFAYVEFDSVEHAQEATAKPILVMGRPCRVDYDHGDVKKSFRTETGRLWHKSYGGPPPKKQQQQRQQRRGR